MAKNVAKTPPEAKIGNIKEGTASVKTSTLSESWHRCGHGGVLGFTIKAVFQFVDF